MIDYILYAVIAYLIYEIFTGSSDNEDDSKLDHVPYEDPEQFPGFPNTWYPILPSKELAVNGVLPFQISDDQLVAFRGPSGNVHILSAYCPHLGANLGVGGHVVREDGDDCIQCPFHGWRFGGADGQCKHIPNLEKAELKPLKASVKKWSSLEQNGVIYVWFHSEGKQPDHQPVDYLDRCRAMKLSLTAHKTQLVNTYAEKIIQCGSDKEFVHYVFCNVVGELIRLRFLLRPIKTDQDKKYTEIGGVVELCFLGKPFHIFRVSVRTYAPLHSCLVVENPGLFSGPIAVTLATVPYTANTSQFHLLVYTAGGLFNKLRTKVYRYLVWRLLQSLIKILELAKQPKEPAYTDNDDLIVEFNKECQNYYTK